MEARVGVEWPIAVLLLLAAGAAGWVDAVAGGGGLIQLPSILAAGVKLPEAMGVNKTSSVCGTSAALLRYARHGHVRWAEVPRCGVLALIGSAIGSLGLIGVTKQAKDALIPVFAVCFLALATQQVLKVLRPPAHDAVRRRRPALGYALMLAIGLYDGFIGPGAGMFMFWTFTTCFALAPLAATGTTKAINVITNVGALIPLLLRGHTLWPLALGMGAANLLGGTLGSHAAIRNGAGLVRIVAALVSVGASVYLLVR